MGCPRGDRITAHHCRDRITARHCGDRITAHHRGDRITARPRGHSEGSVTEFVSLREETYVVSPREQVYVASPRGQAYVMSLQGFTSCWVHKQGRQRSARPARARKGLAPGRGNNGDGDGFHPCSSGNIWIDKRNLSNLVSNMDSVKDKVID